MRPEMTLLLCPVLLHGFLLVPTRWAESGRRAAVPARWGTLVASEDGNADQNPPVDEEFSKDLYAELNIRMDGDQAEAAGTAESDFEGESDSDLSSFTDELYAHLSKRPEYATSEFYKGIKSRVDVTEPMYSELDRRREMLTNASLPNPSLGPNDVIDLVLRALQDVDYPYEGHGVEVLMNCTGPGSSINPGSQKVSPEMLYKYFETSKQPSRAVATTPAAALAHRPEEPAPGGDGAWGPLRRAPKRGLGRPRARDRLGSSGRRCALRLPPALRPPARQVPHPLGVELDPVPEQARDVAEQQPRLPARQDEEPQRRARRAATVAFPPPPIPVSPPRPPPPMPRAGAWVPVTFQLSKYETEAGSVWLIDQFLVKSADRRGEPAGPESIF